MSRRNQRGLKALRRKHRQTTEPKMWPSEVPLLPVAKEVASFTERVSERGEKSVLVKRGFVKL
jgi:hypothetical protein